MIPRFHPFCKCHSLDGNGVGRAVLKPLQGGFRMMSHEMTLSKCLSLCMVAHLTRPVFALTVLINLFFSISFLNEKSRGSGRADIRPYLAEQFGAAGTVHTVDKVFYNNKATVQNAMSRAMSIRSINIQRFIFSFYSGIIK